MKKYGDCFVPRPKSMFYLLVVTMAIALSCGVRASDTVDLVVLHTNDFHGNLLPFEDSDFAPPPETMGGAAYLAAKVKEIRAKFPGRVILLDSGDIAQGTVLSNTYRGKPVADYMNYLQYDAMTLGNHEFDWGLDELGKIVSALKFPVVCANATMKDTGDFIAGIKPYMVVERDGTKIGIIGVATPETASLTFPRNVEGVAFLDPAAQVGKYVKELNSKGIRIVFVLSHLGIQGDRKLAQQVPGITVIFGGHTHIAFRRTLKYNDTIVLQAGTQGEYLGRLRLKLNRQSGEILYYNEDCELIPIFDSDITPDGQVQDIIGPYAEKSKAMMEEVLGQARCEITRTKMPGSADTPMGSLVTDVVREKAGADAAVYNSGGIRTSLAAGDITRGEIYAAMPFENIVISVDLSGKEILETLNSLADQDIPIQVSGMSYSFAPRGEKGKRVQSLMIGDRDAVPDKIYRFATIDFLYDTSSDDSALRRGRNIVYGKSSRELLEEYIKDRKIIEPPANVRIRLQK